MNKYIDYIKLKNLGDVYLDKSFKDITTLGVGGKIALLYYPNSTISFIKFYRYYLENKDYPLLCIGGGSNVLSSDKEYNGIVVCFKNINEICIRNSNVVVSSGYDVRRLSVVLKYLNLKGGEYLNNLPATVGGIITMNASCYGYKTSSILKRCLCINENGILKWYKSEEMNFGYRNSIIKRKGLIVLKGEFIFEKGDIDEIQKITNTLKKYRYDNQPLNYKNAGSVFKNTNEYTVWKIIDDLGFRGYNINDAYVSNKHCNFIVNRNNASSSDIFKLVKLIKQKAKEKYNIDLECEWTLINF